MLIEIETGEECGIEQGCRHLGDTAAEVGLHLSFGDDAGRLVAVGGCALAQGFVEAELLTGQQYGARDLLRGHPQVGVAVGFGVVRGGELRDDGVDIGLLGVLGRELRIGLGQCHLGGAIIGGQCRQHGVGEFLLVNGDALLARHDLRFAVDDLVAGVLHLLADLRALGQREPLEPFGVEDRCQVAVLGLELQGLRHGLR